MRKLDFTPSFKKEMSNIEIAGIEHVLQEELNEFDADLYDTRAEDYYGLAYTSSSSYAMYNITNYHENDEGEEMKHFALTNNDMLVLVTHDKEETEHFYEVSF